MRTGPRTAALLALCCATAAGLTGCGGPARDGYTAVGAAAPGPERGAGDNVAPRGRVEFHRLGGPSTAGASSASAAAPPGAASDTSPGTPGGTSGARAPGGGSGGAPVGAGPGRTAPAPGTPSAPLPPTGPGTPQSPPGTPGTPTRPGTGPGTTPPAPPPATAARLTLSAPARAGAADRWCERVTVTFTNAGTTAARSGTVSFATHIIGALGIDWATITTTQPLPAPIAGGASKTQAYTVCVESWRVPLGMRVETRKVTAAWN
ncbi:hypothetical protein ACFWUQ_01115 [Streptomyces sp. NPDC058662]|uniref:hypothetical protein n=1 Tax=Streptomyces sp. NPDC058662 TaxID=3346583 RepID=UPI00366821F2